MLVLLNELEESVDSGAVSLYMPSVLSVPEIESLLTKINIQAVPDGLIEKAASSKNGAVVLWGSTQRYLVLPPFPIREETTFSGYIAEPLRQLLDSSLKIGLILVHLGTYAIGVCQGEELITSKVGTGLIHGRHKKGGSSQQRFQRRRQKQVEEFLDRVCNHAKAQFEPHARELDYVIYGGPHQTVLMLQKRCAFLKSFEDRVLSLLDVPSLRQKVLETVVGRIWSSRITEWQEV
ncbi:MAG: hypothetical protein JSW16_08055 [Dehalococcoidales bacterium]|nr:MAG: hypothetical protein JSW16_08055 [Dehalococcoidales bacterium]